MTTNDAGFYAIMHEAVGDLLHMGFNPADPWKIALVD
jgi:hypothetical protein